MLLRDCFVAGRRTISVDALRLGACCWTLAAASAPAALTRVLIVWCHSTSKTQKIPNGVYTYETRGSTIQGGESLLFKRPAGSRIIVARGAGAKNAKVFSQKQVKTVMSDER